MAKDPANLLKQGGVYKIYFKGNPSDFYIGSAINFSERRIRHRHHLKKQIHRNTYLQRLCNKYGLNNFVFEIVEIVLDLELIVIREQFYIDTLKPKINVLKIAGNCFGFRHTEQTKKYLSYINTGRKMTKEQNIKNSIAQIGNANAKGSVRTDEFKKNLSLIKMKKVVDITTGKVFSSIGEASFSAGLKYQTLYAKLSGRNINNTNLRFI